MQNRFAVALTLLGVAAAVLWAALYALATYQGWWPEPTVNNKFFEFDFAGYSFGLVAVAVSAAGVYVSIVTDRISDQMMRVIELHFVPNPFQERKLIEEHCAPEDTDNGKVHRTAHVKVIWAITQLVKWPTLEDEKKKDLLGTEGLDAEKLGLAKPFPKLQDQFDRKLVLQFAIIIAAIYATIPFLYFFVNGRIVVTVLFTLYVLCIAEIVLCSALFYKRSRFMALFEMRVGSWRPDVENYLVRLLEVKVAEEAQAAGNQAGAPGAASGH